MCEGIKHLNSLDAGSNPALAKKVGKAEMVYAEGGSLDELCRFESCYRLIGKYKQNLLKLLNSVSFPLFT